MRGLYFIKPSIERIAPTQGLKPFEDTEVPLHRSHASRYEVGVRMFLLFPSQERFQNGINSIVAHFC